MLQIEKEKLKQKLQHRISDQCKNYNSVINISRDSSFINGLKTIKKELLNEGFEETVEEELFQLVKNGIKAQLVEDKAINGFILSIVPC